MYVPGQCGQDKAGNMENKIAHELFHKRCATRNDSSKILQRKVGM